MGALTSLMTRFYAGEDSWLARSNNLSKNSGSPDVMLEGCKGLCVRTVDYLIFLG